MSGLGKQTRGNGIARVMKSVGGPADMSEAHEGMESKAEEAKEYAMEEKGYKETKSGKMVKAAKGGSIKKDTHITKDGRIAKKGLYYYMNRAKKLGKSRPGKGTVSDKALKASAKTAKK